jgi:predicted aldo/keto reductase-like oxidoreductase
MTIPRRKLGSTGEEVSILGLGGEGILRTFGYELQATRLINQAIDLGINYLESARAYSGSEVYYGLALAERRKDIFLTSKSHARTKKGAQDHLAETLLNMKTDYLDLWQVHDVRADEDVAAIFGPEGAIEAFVEAKKKGMVRFIGVTGHQDPAILRKCFDLFNFDTVLIPVNSAENFYNSFIDSVIPTAVEKNMGIIGMKVYFRGIASQLPWYESMRPFLYYSLSKPVSAVVIGCDNIKQLEENVALASDFRPLGAEEVALLEEKTKRFARSLMYYKQDVL